MKKCYSKVVGFTANTRKSDDLSFSDVFDAICLTGSCLSNRMAFIVKTR
jgi:hypothetical protein